MQTFSVQIKRIIFSNPDNGFTIATVRDEHRAEFTITGSFAALHTRQDIVITGDWTTHPRFGRQFKVESYEEKRPASRDAVIRYLSSGFIKGVGKVLSEKIVDALGENAIEALHENPNLIYNVKELGKKKAAAVLEGLAKQREVEKIMLFLKEYNVGNALAVKIYTRYGQESINIIKENPYVLADDIRGIGFVTADKLALSMGVQKNDINRLRSGIEYCLEKQTELGHVFIPKEELLSLCSSVLDSDISDIEKGLEAATERKTVIVDDKDRVYGSMQFHCERYVAGRIVEMTLPPEKKHKVITVNEKELSSNTGISYDDVQLDAIKTIVNNRISILTGGPGTGKTTTVKGVMSVLEKEGLNILMAAPTGRAAKRMQESTGHQASTIHRLLEVNDEGFNRCKENPLKGDVLIVDECSMIDILLMNSLLKAVPESMKVLLVGDMDQLPSVGPGNVLRDLIGSGKVPTVKLTHIFRQAQDSNIITNAHRINAGQMPVIDNRESSDFLFLAKEEPETIRDSIVDLAVRRIPNKYGIDPLEVQVLSPMRKGPAGTEELNRVFQEKLNPEGPQLMKGAVIFRRGDKVMQVHNDYDKNVFNGDIGFITEVDTAEDKLTCEFNGETHEYSRAQLDDLELAYATTIHKSQGSEYPFVIIPATTSHYVMLQRNLLYTAVTRAKKTCVIVGQSKALAMMVKQNNTFHRNTALKEKINPFASSVTSEEERQ